MGLSYNTLYEQAEEGTSFSNHTSYGRRKTASSCKYVIYRREVKQGGRNVDPHGREKGEILSKRKARQSARHVWLRKCGEYQAIAHVVRRSFLGGDQYPHLVCRGFQETGVTNVPNYWSRDQVILEVIS